MTKKINSLVSKLDKIDSKLINMEDNVENDWNNIFIYQTYSNNCVFESKYELYNYIINSDKYNKLIRKRFVIETELESLYKIGFHM